MARKTPQQAKHSAKRTRAASPAKKHPHAKKHAPPPGKVIARQQLFPIVGVGASAGGLEAFTALLKHLPVDSGMAFVLIQHLDPKQHSGLTELLSRATKMPVREVNANTPIEPNHVYVIAPAVVLSMSDGYIQAGERGGGRNLPIDYFLRSLARDNTSKAIGIVLSGTASDGTLGLKAVKAEGGVTFAQEPSSAKFDGMPRSAIAAGVVDFVLTPEEIAKRLVRVAQHSAYGTVKAEKAGEAAQEVESALTGIFHILRTVTGNDFTHYKHMTIRRRIHRRMVVHASEKLGDYAAYIQGNPAEARALSDDLLICVTAFFREPKYFEALAATVFPAILKNRLPDASIRVWVSGCATGEEAYSVAICLTEFLERVGGNVPLQIFASDISESAIEKARAGIYPEAALAEVSPDRLKRFFVKVQGGYQIAKAIRQACVFAKQNITSDPPFHNLDLITCCNVLIYFGPVLQRKTLATFHYALKPGGFLMLGPSESVGNLSHAFTALGNKLRIYLKLPGAERVNVQYLTVEPLAARESAAGTVGGGFRAALEVQKTAERILLAQYAPASLIVDDAMNIVHVRGETAPYLQVAPGEPTYSLLKMAREGLVVGLRTALIKARKMKTAVSGQARVKHGGQFRDVTLRVVPVNGPGHAGAPHFMILFEEARPTARFGEQSEENVAERRKTGDPARPAKTPGPRSVRETVRLKQELAATREYLQSIIEEQEASTEELKSANEEAQASNEELETSKEELQSANEELNTVNDELKVRNTDLTEVNADLANVLASINVPLVMVEKNLNIRRFTPAMEPMLNLIDSDVGRSISDLRPNVDVPDLPELLRGVVRGGNPIVREIQGPNGGWFSLQALPYKTRDNKIDGALLLLLDIDAVRRGRDFAETIVETVRQPLLILSRDLKVRSANRMFYETFRVRKEDTENRFVYDLGNGQWGIPKLRGALEKILPEKGEFHDFEVDHKFEGIGHKWMMLDAREIRQETPFGGPAILLAIEDITERRRADNEIKRVNDDLRHFAYAASHDLQEPLRMVTSYSQLLSREFKGKLDKQAHQYLTYVVEGAQRMDALLKGMREYWQAGERGEERRAALDCNNVLEKALLNLRETVTGSGAAITHDLLPTVWAEEVMLVQLFQNLIGNAIKYRSTKPPRVHISALKNGEKEWVFSVKDDGIGIDSRDAEKIFDIFTRGDGNQRPGSGIGLAICRKVVEGLGGRIWVESKAGRGADFRFTIPQGD